MLYDHDRITEIAQLFQYPDESLGVTTVESYAGFVEDVKASYEAATQTGCKVDTLAFAARQRVTQAVERQIGQTYIHQELQAVVDFHQQTFRNQSIVLGELQVFEEFIEVGNRHLY